MTKNISGGVNINLLPRYLLWRLGLGEFSTQAMSYLSQYVWSIGVQMYLHKTKQNMQ